MLVYPKENIKVVDRYNWEIRLAQIQLAQWFIVPIYRRGLETRPSLRGCFPLFAGGVKLANRLLVSLA